MSQRYTKRDAEDAFDRFTHAFNLPIRTRYGAKDGTFYLSWTGGYRIEQVSGTSGERHAFGATRHTAREFTHMCNFAIDALYEKEKLDEKNR